MLKKKKNSIEWLEFEILQSFPQVIHSVFWNFPLGERDDSSHPEKAFNLLGLKKGVKLKQCHKNSILHVDKDSNDLYEDFDGMMTNDPAIGLLIRHADCQATLFYDPVHQALANVHCGWRGSVLNIYQTTIQKMGKAFGTRPEDLIVCIGPSLGPSNAEFKHYQSELPTAFWKHQVRPTYFNFWEISKEQLLKSGVLKEHIEIAEICTYEEGFSYRKNKETPHHGTIAALCNNISQH